MRSMNPFSLSLFALVALLGACGDGEDYGGSSFDESSGSGSTSSNGNNNASNGNGNASFGTGGSGSSTTTATDGTCGAVSAAAQAVPVNMIVVFDRSGSMNDDGKWTAAQSAMSSFFSDPTSSGISASLVFFPRGYNDPADCELGSYSNPDVALTALPSAAFGQFMSQVQANGGTPTLPAVTGAIQYAQQIAGGVGSQGKTVIALVTDGEPNECNSSVQGVSSQVQTVASTIPTYVVGVGNDLQALNAVAQAGGTKQSIVVSQGNPTQTQKDLLAAFAAIKKNAIGCEYQLPNTNGQQLDTDKVNVLYTGSSGQQQPLSYDATCANAQGWHYDNPTTPTKIQICPNACAMLQNEASAKIDIQLGCKTIGVK